MLAIISILSPLLPIILFLAFCLKKSKRELWVIFFYDLLTLGVDVFQFATRWGRENSFIILGVFTIVEYCLFAYFFILSIDTRYLKKVILIISVAVIIFLVFIFFRSNKNNFDSISASTEAISIIIFSIIYFFEQINKPQQYFIYSSPNFWIVLAFMIYMSGTLFLFIMANSLPENEIRKDWIINNISNIVTNIIFCISFLVSRFAAQHPATEKSSIEYTNVRQKP